MRGDWKVQLPCLSPPKQKQLPVLQPKLVGYQVAADDVPAEAGAASGEGRGDSHPDAALFVVPS